MLIKIDFYLVSLRKYPLLINSSIVANRAIESSATAIIRTEPIKVYVLVFPVILPICSSTSSAI
jgi:ABC-type transport system involved in cytochrome c biogenesis permease component